MGLDMSLIASTSVSKIHYSEELFIGLLSPFTSYRTAVAAALTKREDVAAVQVQPDIMIAVAPSGIDGPDIVRVIVERDGKVVAATLNTLIRVDRRHPGATPLARRPDTPRLVGTARQVGRVSVRGADAAALKSVALVGA